LEKETRKAKRSRSRLLTRGESSVAFIGITMPMVLVIAFAVGVWWLKTGDDSAAKQASIQQVEIAGKTLTKSAEVMMVSDDLSGLRRVVVAMEQSHQFSQCRIELPDGQVVADIDPRQITLTRLPDKWDGSLEAQASIVIQGTTIMASHPIHVYGRGPASLLITAPMQTSGWLQSETQTGLGAIGAISLILLLLIYRRSRSKLQALGAIRESLLAMDQGEKSGTALQLNPIFGAEAIAWNSLISERDNQQQSDILERAHEQLGGGGGADLRGACDAISQGLILVDKDMITRYVNGAAATFLQADKQSLIGAGLSNFLTEEAVLEALTEAATGSSRKRSTIELEKQTEEGRGVLRYLIRPVRQEDSAAAMILIEDVTQQRVADQARNEFVAQATHELRTPLTNIRLYVETALDEGESDPALRAQSLNVINQESARLERIVDDMLKVSEIEAGSLKVTNDDIHLDELLANLLADYEKQAEEKGIALAFNLPPKFPVFQADRDKLNLAMHNLVANAMKYTKSGGRVAVNVDFGEENLIFEVRDTGLGISDEDQEHIFDKFYRADDRRIEGITGTGLGLALAREVIRLHGGDITVESQVDQGSTFTLTVPTNAEAA
jgi:signal transduction histidine kinase